MVLRRGLTTDSEERAEKLEYRSEFVDKETSDLNAEAREALFAFACPVVGCVEGRGACQVRDLVAGSLPVLFFAAPRVAQG